MPPLTIPGLPHPSQESRFKVSQLLGPESSLILRSDFTRQAAAQAAHAYTLSAVSGGGGAAAADSRTADSQALQQRMSTAMAAILGGHLDDASVAPVVHPSKDVSHPLTSGAAGGGEVAADETGGGAADEQGGWHPKKRDIHAVAAGSNRADSAGPQSKRAYAEAPPPVLPAAATAYTDLLGGHGRNGGGDRAHVSNEPFTGLHPNLVEEIDD